MRPAILCPSFGEYGGIGRIADALIREFRAAGHSVSLICRPGAAASEASKGIPRLAIPMHQLPRRWGHLARHARLARTLWQTVPRIRGFLRAEEADVLFHLAISTYAPVALAMTSSLPVVVSLQGGEPNGRFAAHPGLFRHLLLRAAAVTACATSLAREAARLAPAITGRLSVVPNGVAVDRFTGAPPFAHPRPYLLAAGRFTRQKGFDVLIRAAAEVDAVRSGRVDVLLAGDGAEEAALRALVAQHELVGRVSFLGPVDETRMAALYRGARAVVVPSRWEGLPLVCLEAMASGRPVVASRVDGIPDAVVDEETGLLVPPEDAPLLARALERVLVAPAWAEQLGEAGARRARDAFAWPGIARRYLDVFARAAASRLP
ncbi:MAG TPA: glycosyltransferase family 4 protein [Candidatus Limnocylindria bacterium]|nr:glycosyltransferase family 4 protein [Candidatus Limnocylindria bacterium]